MPTEILVGLWIGDKNDAHNLSFIKNNNIKSIINCTSEIDFAVCDNIKKYRISIDDYSSKKEQYLYNNKKILKHFDTICDIIHQYILNNESILIHSNLGKQRSVAICVAYLIKYSQLDKKDIIHCIKTKNTSFFSPFSNFAYALDKFQKSL